MNNQYTSVTEYVEKRLCGVGVTFSFNANTGKMTRHIIYCKKRSCPNCEEFWRRRHLNRLQEREKNLLFHGKRYTDFHLVLTTAYKVEKEKVYAAFRYFFQLLRSKIDGKVEYFCSVEQNRKATQPHFHFLLSIISEQDVSFVDYRMIRKFWVKAQNMAQFEKLANQTFTKRLNGNNAGWYMLKYITKKDDKSYEVPTKEVWNGRTVRASRGFYPVSVSVLDIAFYSRKTFDEPSSSNYTITELFPSVNQATGSRFDVFQGLVRASQVSAAEWDIHSDYSVADNGSRKPFSGCVGFSRTLSKALDIFETSDIIAIGDLSDIM